MPDAFSPSRSLKYWRITLRTVEESSFSRAASDLESDLFLGCKCHLVVVFKSRRMREQLAEERRYGGELHFGALEGFHSCPEHGGVLESFRVPADVLARHSRAALVTVERIQVVQMPYQDLADFRDAGRRKVRAGREEM